MNISVEIVFRSGGRKSLPFTGYRPDAIFNENGDYWGVIFSELEVEKFDIPTMAKMKFSAQECHYNEISVGQQFWIMEGSRQVATGRVLSIDSSI